MYTRKESRKGGHLGKTPSLSDDFTFQQIFDAQITRNRIKIAVIGEKNCGKSALISRFAHDAFDEMKTSSKSCVVFQRPIAGTISKVELVEIGQSSSAF